MQIIGFMKNSFVDYPTLISSVIFTPGCTLDCWYCHNREIIHEREGIYQEENILKFLEERKGFLDGVVISGGEPTMQADLPEFVKKVRTLGLKVKLDTSGTNYQMLEHLISNNLLDYIAMDIKAPMEHYGKITSASDKQKESIKKSISLVKNSGIDYEFRTTFAPNLTVQDIKDLLIEFAPMKTYSLQAYKKPSSVTQSHLKEHEKEAYQEIKDFAHTKKLVENFNIKNID